MLRAHPVLRQARDVLSDSLGHIVCRSSFADVGMAQIVVGSDTTLYADVQGNTPLNLTCFLGREDLVNFFVENGADVNVANHFGLRPLHHAFYRQDSQMSDYLLF